MAQIEREAGRPPKWQMLKMFNPMKARKSVLGPIIVSGKLDYELINLEKGRLFYFMPSHVKKPRDLWNFCHGSSRPALHSREASCVHEWYP
jgi:hypothetical protein